MERKGLTFALDKCKGNLSSRPHGISIDFGLFWSKRAIAQGMIGFETKKELGFKNNLK